MAQYTKSDLEAAFKFGQSNHSFSTFARWFDLEYGRFALVQCDEEIAAQWAPISGENWEIVSVESPDDPTLTKSYDCYGMYNDE